MDYNTFFNSPSVRDRFFSLSSQLPQTSASSSSPVLINAVSYQPIEHMSYGFKYNFFNLKNNISAFLPMETSERVWTTLMGIAVPVLCYAGYKVWKWIIQMDEENKQEPYEYKYIKELDDMLQTKLDDIQNPEMAKILNYLTALYPALRIDPENLAPLVELSKKHRGAIDSQMSGNKTKTGTENAKPSDRNLNHEDDS